jgi:hypothetical protein
LSQENVTTDRIKKIPACLMIGFIGVVVVNVTQILLASGSAGLEF